MFGITQYTSKQAYVTMVGQLCRVVLQRGSRRASVDRSQFHRACVVPLTILILCTVGCGPDLAPALQSPSTSSGTTSAGDISNNETLTAEQPEATTSASEEPVTGNAPNVALELASIKQVEDVVAQQSGKVVVVDIWSTSCVPCMQEFHNLVELHQKAKDDVTCISLNVDYIGLKKKPADTYLEKALKFLESQEATHLNFLASDPDTDVLDHFAVGSMPAILIYDRQGKLMHTLSDSNASGEGLAYEADVLPKVDVLLQE